MNSEGMTEVPGEVPGTTGEEEEVEEGTTETCEGTGVHGTRTAAAAAEGGATGEMTTGATAGTTAGTTAETTGAAAAAAVNAAETTTGDAAAAEAEAARIALRMKGGEVEPEAAEGAVAIGRGSSRRRRRERRGAAPMTTAGPLSRSRLRS